MSLFQDAKEILDNGNNKQVKSIKNSNGDIIWGSQSAFPYRRLQYIHFSGAEHIMTGFVPNYNKSIKFKLNVTGSAPSPSDGNNVLFGGWCGTLSNNTSRRLFWVWSPNASAYRAVIGNTWNDTSASYTDTDVNWFGMGFPNNSAFKNAAFGIRDVAWENTLYYTNQTNTTSFTGWTTQLALGGENTQTNSVDSTRYSCINVYEGYQHDVASPWQTDVDYGAVKHWIPCQRKSDGVCGLYDVLNNTFYPMQGTTITSGAAGPVVDEYWDLQA